MHAIDTIWCGYKFRSRLEARWTVFFAAMGTPYLYEHEGFHLPSGNYLPDFWMPVLECWIEIKAKEPSPIEKRLCEELANHTGKAVAIFWGLPDENGGLVFCADSNDNGSGTQWWYGVVWSFSAKQACFDSKNNCKSRSFMSPNWDSFSGMKLSRECDEYPYSDRLAAAIDKSKSARFEHGEKP